MKAGGQGGRGSRRIEIHSLVSLLSTVTPDLSLDFPSNILKPRPQDEKPAGPRTKAWPNLPSPHGETLGTLAEAAGTEWETLSFLLKPMETVMPPARRGRTKEKI